MVEATLTVPTYFQMLHDTWAVFRAFPLWSVIVGWALLAGPVHLVLQPVSRVYYSLTDRSPDVELSRGRTQLVLGVIALSVTFPALAMALAMGFWMLT